MSTNLSSMKISDFMLARYQERLRSFPRLSDIPVNWQPISMVRSTNRFPFLLLLFSQHLARVLKNRVNIIPASLLEIRQQALPISILGQSHSVLLFELWYATRQISRKLDSDCAFFGSSTTWGPASSESCRVELGSQSLPLDPGCLRGSDIFKSTVSGTVLGARGSRRRLCRHSFLA
jgi:hypothetical protein